MSFSHCFPDVSPPSGFRVGARRSRVQHAGQPVPVPRALLYRTARNLVTDPHRPASLRDHDGLDR
jgi:hypothetical protein